MNQRTLFAPPKRARTRDAGAVCRRAIEKAVARLLLDKPTCEDIGQVLECFHELARDLESRMHD